ncbi:MAG: serine hydrolase [Thermomicrobiales bacterium]
MATGERWQAVQDAVDAAPSGARVAVTAIDLATGASFRVRGDEAFKAASTIKVLILATMARQVDAGTLDLDRMVPLPAERKVGGSGVLNWLTTGIVLPLRDYAWLMIAISDNTASNVCIDAVGLDAVQETADALGLPTLHLGRLFKGVAAKPGDPENIASSDDLAALMAAIARGEVAGADSTAWMLQVLGEQQYLDRLPGRMAAGVTWQGKTGSLDGIHHDAGIYTGPHGQIAVACLTEGIADNLQANAVIATIGAAVSSLVA